MILTIDPGSSLGFSLWTEEGELIEYGVKKVTSSAKANIYERMAEMSNHIKGLFAPSDYGTISRLIIEDVNIVSMKSRDASRWRGATWGYPTILAAQKGVPLIEVVPSKLKKHITGNGKAKKVLMVKSVNERLGLKNKNLDHNAADALALGMFYFDTSVNQTLT